MTIEEHPLFMQWKTALDQLVQIKQRMDTAETINERMACAFDYGNALNAYYQIADDL
jgi:hypothetical protein